MPVIAIRKNYGHHIALLSAPRADRDYLTLRTKLCALFTKKHERLEVVRLALPVP